MSHQLQHPEYTQDFYERHHDRIMPSVEMMTEFLFSKVSGIKSVVDFGCGTGEWLGAAQKFGAMEVCGVDGDWVKNVKRYFIGDVLYTDLDHPVIVKKKYDLAISLEVAEHLTPTRADGFVDDLCRAAEIVLFSAAIRGQGGPGHINEQPQSYWQNLFAKKSYGLLDVMRAPFWHNPKVRPYYAQNTFLYVKANRMPELAKAFEGCMAMPTLDIEHPYIHNRDPEVLEAIYKRHNFGLPGFAQHPAAWRDSFAHRRNG